MVDPQAIMRRAFEQGWDRGLNGGPNLIPGFVPNGQISSETGGTSRAPRSLMDPNTTSKTPWERMATDPMYAAAYAYAKKQFESIHHYMNQLSQAGQKDAARAYYQAAVGDLRGLLQSQHLAANEVAEMFGDITGGSFAFSPQDQWGSGPEPAGSEDQSLWRKPRALPGGGFAQPTAPSMGPLPGGQQPQMTRPPTNQFYTPNTAPGEMARPWF